MMENYMVILSTDYTAGPQCGARTGGGVPCPVVKTPSKGV